MSYSDATSLFTNRLRNFVTFKEATMCYALSKMTVEKDFSAEYGYKKLEFVEFMEYICRIANEKYKTATDLVICDKLEKVLDAILPIVNAYRKDI